jgi:hypothetical protein
LNKTRDRATIFPRDKKISPRVPVVAGRQHAFSVYLLGVDVGLGVGEGAVAAEAGAAVQVL